MFTQRCNVLFVGLHYGIEGGQAVERRIYHVSRRGDDSWQVMREGFRRPHIVLDSKAEAILMAKRLAKVVPYARVIVHSQDDHVEREFSFTHRTSAWPRLCTARHRPHAPEPGPNKSRNNWPPAKRQRLANRASL